MPSGEDSCLRQTASDQSCLPQQWSFNKARRADGRAPTATRQRLHEAPGSSSERISAGVCLFNHVISQPMAVSPPPTTLSQATRRARSRSRPIPLHHYAVRSGRHASTRQKQTDGQTPWSLAIRDGVHAYPKIQKKKTSSIIVVFPKNPFALPSDSDARAPVPKKCCMEPSVDGSLRCRVRTPRCRCKVVIDAGDGERGPRGGLGRCSGPWSGGGRMVDV